MMQFTLLALVLGFKSVLGQDEVTTDLGTIRGKSFTTRNGKTVSGYLGIPYAKPPIGELRFKSPQRYTDKFEDVFMADTDANMCPQLNDDGQVVGDEDCLYLNVYMPAESSDALLPTMVYFHGGHFVKGSGSSIDAGPEYLLDRDIVLVTLNYRLGALGFLSTGNSVSPGNNGLKDQNLALRWVKDNISKFKGDPGQVTLFGNDAGGASTTIHVIFEFSKGLFKQYISQSASSSTIWAFEDRHYAVKRAKALGNSLNCPTTDSQDLVDCLRKADINSLVDSNDIFDDGYWNYASWTPTDEDEDDDGAFITMFPMTKVLFNDPPNTRGLIGNVKDEGLYLTAELYNNQSLYDTIANNNFNWTKTLVDPVFNENTPENIMNTIYDFYFKDVSMDDKDAFIQAWTRFITDAAYRFPENYQTTFMLSDDSDNVFFYNFDYRGSFSRTSDIIGSDKDIGITQGDMLLYLFPMKKSPGYKPSESDNKMIDIMIDLWTSFAKTGTPMSQAISDPNIWKPYGKDQVGLRIGDKSDPTATELYPAMDMAMKLWTTAVNARIYESYIEASQGR